VTASPSLAAGPDWGSVPDWLAAIGTLAAFAVALRLLAKELAARREQEEDRRQEQAHRVSIWMEHFGTEAAGNFMLLLVRSNRSDEPVYSVSFCMEHPDEPGSVTREDTWPLLPPGTQTDGPLVLTYPPGPATLTFTDAAGRRWKRYPDGRLVEPDRPRRRSRKDT
jgi:hypothetical protein